MHVIVRCLSALCLVLVSSGCSDSHTNADGGDVDGGSVDGGATDAGPRRDGGTRDSGTAAWADCTMPSECVLRANSCCGVCGAPTIGDVDAVNSDRTTEHFNEVCPMPETCPDCPSALNPELIATCRAGRCAPIDVGDHGVTGCTSDLECVVRVPDCCPCGADTSPWNLIALRADELAAYEALVCDPAMACLECEPAYPADVSAVCGADGHCELLMLAPPG